MHNIWPTIFWISPSSKMGTPLSVPFALQPMAWLQLASKSPVRWTINQSA